jgi:hypothetical protein
MVCGVDDSSDFLVEGPSRLSPQKCSSTIGNAQPSSFSVATLCVLRKHSLWIIAHQLSSQKVDLLNCDMSNSTVLTLFTGEVKYCVAKLFSNNVKLEKEWNDL